MGLGLGDLSRLKKVMRWTSNLDWLIEGSVLKLRGRRVYQLKANEQGNRMERFRPEKVMSEVVEDLDNIGVGHKSLGWSF